MADDDVEWIPFKEAAERVGGDLKKTERAITDRAKNGKNKDGSPLIRMQREKDGKKRWLVAWEDVEKWAVDYDTEVTNLLPIPVTVMTQLNELQAELRRESNERAALERIEPFLREQVRDLKAERDELKKQLEEKDVEDEEVPREHGHVWKFFFGQ